MMMMIWDYKREGDELFRRLQGSYIEARINAKRGYGIAKAAVPIPALANRGYVIGYYTPLLDLDCVSVLSNNAGLKTAIWLLYCLRLRSRSPHNA